MPWCKTKEQIRDWIGPWLASQGTYYIPMLGGYKLVDVPDWEHNMPLMLKVINDGTEAMVDIEKYMEHVAGLHEKLKERNYGKAYSPEGSGRQWDQEFTYVESRQRYTDVLPVVDGSRPEDAVR